MNMGDIIKQLRTEKGITQEELGKIIGVQKSAIRKYESGMVQNIKRTSIQKLSDYFGVSPSYLLGISTNKDVASEIRPVALRRFPMIGEIACGKPIFANEEHEAYIDASAEIKADFCVTARGDSMTGARIFNGDIVFIKEQSMVENGQIAAVVIDNEVTLKRWYYYPDKSKLVLQAENPNYEPFVYVGEELNTIRCLGRAVSFMSNL